jgi:hypothetical protein
LASFPAVSGSDYAAVVLDPDTSSEEIVWITAHTASATTATIQRGREQPALGTGVAHTSGAIWKHGPTAADFPVGGNAVVPSDGFRAWTAALDRVIAGTGIATVWGFGASIVAGGTATTDVMTKPYFPLWRANKRLTYATHGDTFLPSSSANFNSLVTYSVVPWTMDVTPTVWGYYGPFIVPVWTTITTMPLCHATHASAALGYNARSARLFYFDAGNQDGGVSTVGRTWSANIDGGANTNVTELGDNLIHTIDFTNLTNAANHVLNIGNQGSGAIAAVPIAVAWYPTVTIPTTGIHYVWAGIPGSFSLFDLARMDQLLPADRIARFIGPSNAAAPFTPNAALSPPFAPDLVFLDVFDDMAFVNVPTASGSTPSFTVNGGPPSVYLHGLRRVIQALRQKSTGCDVVHMMPNFPNSVTSDTQPGAVYQLQNAFHYYEVQKRVAELNGHGWLNTDAEWGERGLALGFLNAGNPHPNDAGHADIYARIGSRLGL